MSQRTRKIIWNPDHRHQVQSLYSMGITVFCLCLGSALLIIGDHTDRITQGIAVGIFASGLVAAKPNIFMPIISAGLQKLPWGPPVSIEEGSNESE